MGKIKSQPVIFTDLKIPYVLRPCKAFLKGKYEVEDLRSLLSEDVLKEAARAGKSFTVSMAYEYLSVVQSILLESDLKYKELKDLAYMSGGIGSDLKAADLNSFVVQKKMNNLFEKKN